MPKPKYVSFDLADHGFFAGCVRILLSGAAAISCAAVILAAVRSDKTDFIFGADDRFDPLCVYPCQIRLFLYLDGGDAVYRDHSLSFAQKISLAAVCGAAFGDPLFERNDRQYRCSAEYEHLDVLRRKGRLYGLLQLLRQAPYAAL